MTRFIESTRTDASTILICGELLTVLRSRANLFDKIDIGLIKFFAANECYLWMPNVKNSRISSANDFYVRTNILSIQHHIFTAPSVFIEKVCRLERSRRKKGKI